MKFGEILSKIETKMVSSYVDGTLKENTVNFKKIVLENKILSNLIHLYTELDKKQGFDKETAELFIHESIRQIEKILPNLELKNITKWTENIVCENQYNQIDNLVYQTPTTIIESVESRKKLISTLCEKQTVKESIKLPLETIFNIAGKELENYIENLDESSKGDLAKVLMTEDTQLSEEFDQLKNKTIESLERISSSNDVETNNKLQETINQIKQDEYSKINYVRLYSLYNNLQ